MKLPESKRFFLREFQESDWSAVHCYAGNLDTVQYMDWGPNTEEDTQVFIKSTLESQKQNPRTHFDFAVIDRTSGLLIGTAGIRIQDALSLVGDFGYILHSDYWGRGIGTEVAQGIVAFGFQELGLHRIWATCRPKNLASARVLEKAGLKYEGYLRENKRVRGFWTDSYLYAITQSDFTSEKFQPNSIQKSEVLSKDQKSILPQIAFEAFERVDIRSGTIVKAEAFPRAKKPAYKIWVDFGPEIGVLQTSAQVTTHYTPEILPGRQVAGVVNLGTRNIAGFESQFLLVGFSDHDGSICLVTVDPKAPNGRKLH